MEAELSLHIRLQQKLFADPRRIELLKRVQQTGSISQGAKLAGISYKSAWDAINEMNQMADETLVERATGGKGGGGATLTRYGERLIQLFQLMEQIQQKAFDALQQDTLPLDSLLAAIARFSLQTSARNQLFGTVVSNDAQQVVQHLLIQLADGVTQLNVALTQRSADRLQLAAGKEVLVLIKAPWIRISRDAAQDDNQLAATVSAIEPGEQMSEVLMKLPSGETLCATLSNDQLQQLTLQPGDAVIASFNAEHAIVATLL
ncbi:molybdenum-dependent transcriptional regulator [Pantoea agglomerans]|jgi:molybdate transport system regulatory protein|uniref:molybdenum-dependent transcriptional regulator n=1 Tax=Pantoea TaxID=53335 RepID=UPI00068BE5F7|nr:MULTISPECIES: molybdenum-dependent transcriptional regulator [Pantoea]KAF6686446.1 molybdenum-dependent transcriptional regulator [Pantoea sp. EKM20T]KOA71479.1 transcriptional regulator [Pantoea sp. CFSAN033090]MBN1088248.1 molybdenum-dependent transcriptional regulator [Pantoea sp. 1B4]NYB30152.1 molybdenum-dependent transcriptional regulator [Pantoea agglomerans]RNA77879.1 molybdenum-dependent transcriptional regulator [[Curtobacterium] plantarum]